MPSNHLSPHEAKNREDGAQGTLVEQEAARHAQNLGLEKPHFVAAPQRRIAGLQRNFTMATRHEIPELWNRFIPLFHQLPSTQPGVSYGVCLDDNRGQGFGYMAGIEIQPNTTVSQPFSQITLPPGRYAVFGHPSHVTKLYQTIHSIWKSWIPKCGLAIANSPSFERYTEAFSPETGFGGIEFWVPLQSH